MQGSNDTSKWVLVVEDDRIILTLLDHMLVRRGYRVRTAADGREALSIIDEVDPPSLVLLDVMLPYIDGFELIKRIRESDPWSRVPVIMLTAKAQERDVVRALDAGASDYIVKPFKPEELIARVRRFVG
ncbi:MAG: response regulator transcription factor [Longimicrobiales bacterium]